MKIIHTGDWHLGKILNGKQFLEDQEYILNQLINKINEENPDVFIISGDIYDTTYPSKETIKLFEKTLSTINIKMNIPTIITNGNHDGKERLNYGSTWFQHSNLYIRTKLEDMNYPITINGVNFYTLPFATVSEIKVFFEDDSIESYEQATQRCIAYISETMNKDEVNVLIAHLTINGGKTSDSERPLTIGTVESVDKASFNIFDKVLLGHLHHPFSIEDNVISYSGSLLQYSFSESNQPKGYKRLVINSKEDITNQFIQLKPLRELEVIEGEYEDVIQGNVKMKNKENYFHFKLRNMSHINDPMIQLKQLYPNTLSLSNITFESSGQFYQAELKQEDDVTIIKQFYKTIADQELTDYQSNKIHDLLNQVINKEV
ncbi:exonuclease SbcCD subunit D [Staphylococcus sp. NRL 16/872]|uniref:exonuclease subunit SbcD n=1 Tax=Staphylococcus sp. NRL 16/872 TaxID=2930131 RepID=UPI001FB39FE0|nr:MULTISPECIES: exonuclease subunit SbcD [unclassified Staphylococcus]MCJ1656426.1 exonuclease SbcCD subunit D [Staphylococcus sp. NRL 21/187]MCJ1662195.1 exonuclease SbcCD subunit D [Staphylococcus sp. NRL 18/288]MCJ1668264.1 exonuclease SbcCD subunit D [Staphylococcus sp. NRL 19/737]WEN68463.1 exonuclease SbcCD subunit D [Staphylococcus sp. NRL 16/872]